MDAQKAVSRLEGEVTSFHNDFRTEVGSLRTGIGKSLGRGEFWTAVTIVIGLIITVGGLYWLAMGAKFDTIGGRIDNLSSKLDSVSKRIEPNHKSELPTVPQ